MGLVLGTLGGVLTPGGSRHSLQLMLSVALLVLVLVLITQQSGKRRVLV